MRWDSGSSARFHLFTSGTTCCLEPTQRPNLDVHLVGRACIFGERQETGPNAGPRARKSGHFPGCILDAWGCLPGEHTVPESRQLPLPGIPLKDASPVVILLSMPRGQERWGGAEPTPRLQSEAASVYLIYLTLPHCVWPAALVKVSCCTINTITSRASSDNHTVSTHRQFTHVLNLPTPCY